MGNDKAKVSAKPLDLIVANSTHDMVATIDNAEHAANVLAEHLTAKLTPEQAKAFPKFDTKSDALCEGYARQLLCNIAHQANLNIVLRALESIGAPSASSEIWQRMDAAREAQKREAGIIPAQH